jgi:membrane-associated protein
MDGLLGVTDAVLSWLGALDSWVIYLCAGLFIALETTALVGLVIPGDAVILLAGSTVTSPLGFAAVVLAVTSGAMVGESGGYLLGRIVGPRLRYTRFGRWIREERWARAEAYLRHRGGPALVMVRFVAVIHAVAPLVAGSVRMPFRRFFGWSILGTVIWSSTITSVGALAGASFRQYGTMTPIVTAAAVTVIGLVPFVRFLLRRRYAATAGADPAGRPPASLPADCTTSVS